MEPVTEAVRESTRDVRSVAVAVALLCACSEAPEGEHVVDSPDATGADTYVTADTGAPIDSKADSDAGAVDTSVEPTMCIMGDPTPFVARPTFDPPPTTLIDPCTAPLLVTITTSTPGATLYFTTDGTNPNVSSPKYTSPIALTSTTRLSAFAFLAGKPGESCWFPSDVRAGTYVAKDAPPDDVMFSPPAGSYETDPSVTLTSVTPTTICYTRDGSSPACDSMAKCSGGIMYSGPIAVVLGAGPVVISAISCSTCRGSSAVVTASYSKT